MISLGLVPLPWHQLTDIHICVTTGNIYYLGQDDPVRNILTHCTRLRKCIYEYSWYTRPARYAEDKPLTLPHLQSLRLHSTMTRGVGNSSLVIDILTLPNLLELEFKNQNTEESAVPSIIRLLSRSSCSIETIRHHLIEVSGDGDSLQGRRNSVHSKLRKLLGNRRPEAEYRYCQ